MADTIEIVVHKSGLFVNNAKEFNQEVVDKLNHIMIQSALYAEAEFKRETPVGATGNLRREWKTEISYQDSPMGRLALVEVHNPALYLEPTDKGRRASPISQEGRKSLELWVTRKLGASLAESKSIAYAIARKKAMFPTPGQHFVDRVLDRVVPKIIERVIQEFGDKVKIIAQSDSDEQNLQV